jgi:plasmid stabilization system protein ParE
MAPEEIRDWVVGDYVVRYLIADEGIVVVRVWHGREQRA